MDESQSKNAVEILDAQRQHLQGLREELAALTRAVYVVAVTISIAAAAIYGGMM